MGGEAVKLAALWAWIVVSLACTGCLSWFRGPDRATDESVQAGEMAWRHYGREDKAPHVRMLHPDDFSKRELCTSKTTGRVGFLEVFTQVCVAGVTTPVGADGCSILVMWIPGDKPSDTALAHELLHCARLREHAPLPHHSQGAFKASPDVDGYFFGQVESARSALVAAGL